MRTLARLLRSIADWMDPPEWGVISDELAAALQREAARRQLLEDQAGG